MDVDSLYEVSAFNDFGIWNKMIFIKREVPISIKKINYSEIMRKNLLEEERLSLFDIKQPNSINKFLERVQIQNFFR